MPSYARNAWYVAAWSEEVPRDRPSPVMILGEPIVLWHADGELRAFEDRCFHRMAPLSLGQCQGRTLRCMYHGLLFDELGKVIEIPGQDMIPRNAAVRSYPVEERHSWIWIWMGDPALADVSLIPPAVGLDDPDWILGHGTLDYASEAQLINDNLLDFSHLTFVHSKSFNASTALADNPPKVLSLERGVRFERWIRNSKGQGGKARPGGELVDLWSSYDYLVPGVLLMWNGVYPQGTADRCEGGKPDYSQALDGVTFTSQAVTPVDRNKARYFFSWGPRRDCGDEAMRDALMGIAAMAFAEDREMIEAQQRIIDTDPSRKPAPTIHDRGITLFTRLVEKMARAEADRVVEAA